LVLLELAEGQVRRALWPPCYRPPMVLLIGPSGQMHWPTTVKASLQSVSLKWRFSCGQAVIPPPVSLIAGRLRAFVALGFFLSYRA